MAGPQKAGPSQAFIGRVPVGLLYGGHPDSVPKPDPRTVGSSRDLRMQVPAGPSYGGPQTEFHKTDPSRAFIGQTPAGPGLVYYNNSDSLGPLPKGSPLLEGPLEDSVPWT